MPKSLQCIPTATMELYTRNPDGTLHRFWDKKISHSLYDEFEVHAASIRNWKFDGKILKRTFHGKEKYLIPHPTQDCVYLTNEDFRYIHDKKIWEYRSGNIHCVIYEQL